MTSHMPKFALPTASAASMAVCDLFGHPVKILVDGVVSAGVQEGRWVAGNVSSDVSIVCRQTGEPIYSRRMILMREIWI